MLVSRPLGETPATNSPSQANNHLDQESWSLVTDCIPSAYCEADGTCQPKRCRRDIVSLCFDYTYLADDSSPLDIPMSHSINYLLSVELATCELGLIVDECID
jgi:hypothetical protein